MRNWPGGPSIAVLPLDNLSGNQADSWFADGVTKDIRYGLSKFKSLCVISHKSASMYPGPAQSGGRAAQDLGVDYITEGSVRRDQNRLRLTIELIEAATKRTIWADRYDQDVVGIFDVQDDITGQIVVALTIQIDHAEIQRMRNVPPANLAAYDFVLQGHHRKDRYTAADNRKAQSLFTKALEADGRYARAYAALASACSVAWRYGWVKEPESALDSALSYARQAVQLDPNDGRGFGAMGIVHLDRKEHDLAIHAYNRSLSLNPNDVFVISGMADVLAHCGWSHEAIMYAKRGLRRDPHHPDYCLWALSSAYYNLGRYEEAVEAILKMHDATEGRRLLAASYAQLGQLRKAHEQKLRILDAQPEFSADQWAEMVPVKHAEDLQHYIDGLKKAGL